MALLKPDFYARGVVEVARELIGCTVEHGPTSGLIVETEAYHQTEPACHAFVGLTPRTAPLFGAPGRAYVYRSYGIHALLNAVCEPKGIGAAVLIRALQPLKGIELMAERRRVGLRRRDCEEVRDTELCSGPGKLTQSLEVELSENDTSLLHGPVRIHCRAPSWQEGPIVASPRIGITNAIDLPWRFSLAGNPHVSRPRPRASQSPGSTSISTRG